jgi:hypothetical protein
LLFPVGGALLALTTALAAACFVKAFGISFLALPRSREAAEAHEAPVVMLVPQAFLAALCVGLGLFPGVVLRVLEGVMASLPGLQPRADMVSGQLGMASGLGAFDHVVPVVLARCCWALWPSPDSSLFRARGEAFPPPLAGNPALFAISAAGSASRLQRESPALKAAPAPHAAGRRGLAAIAARTEFTASVTEPRRMCASRVSASAAGGRWPRWPPVHLQKALPLRSRSSYLERCVWVRWCAGCCASPTA